MTPPEEPDTLALTVVGGGLMGASIASVFVANGHHVTVVEADATRRAGLADLIQSQINDIDTLSPAAGQVPLSGVTGSLLSCVGGIRR